jgi:hypothetical protein
MGSVSRRFASTFPQPISPVGGCRTADRTEGGFGGGDGWKRRTGSTACGDAQSNWPKPTERGPNGAELGVPLLEQVGGGNWQAARMAPMGW